MSKADKKVSISNFKHTTFKSKMALITGNNKHIDNKNKGNESMLKKYKLKN